MKLKLSIILDTGWDIDGVGHVFGDSCKMHLDHTGRGDVWKSGPNPKPYWNWYEDWGWTSKQFVDFCNEAADCGCLFMGPIREGYKEAIEANTRMGNHNIFITDRFFGSTPQVSEKLTVDWFKREGIWGMVDQLVFSRNKLAVHTDLFVDDKTENYDDLAAGGVEVYLLNRPWNEPHDDNRRRIDTLDEYVDAIKARTYSSNVV